MKKIIAALALLILSGSLLTAQQKEKSTEAQSYREIGSELPPIRAVDGKMHVHTQDEFKNDYHFFLVMFNPTCGHCIKMAKLIEENLPLFKHNRILFLAGAQMMPYFQDFYKETHIYKYPRLVVAVDSAQTVDKLYTYKTLPQINIYDKDRKLVRSFNGDTPLDSLKQYIP